MFGVCCLLACWYMGWVQLVLSADQTYIVEGISVAFIGALIACMYNPGFAGWVGGMLPAVGLMGTVIGFMIAFTGEVTPEAMVDPESFKRLVARMLSGLGTALSTTLVGVVGYLGVEITLRCASKSKPL